MPVLNVGDKVTIISDFSHLSYLKKGMTGSLVFIARSAGAGSIVLDTPIDIGGGKLSTGEFSISLSNLELTKSLSENNHPFPIGSEVEVIEDLRSTPIFKLANIGLRGTVVGYKGLHSNNDTVMLNITSQDWLEKYRTVYGSQYLVPTKSIKLVEDFHREKTSWTREELDHLWNVTQCVGRFGNILN